ncbi:MAG: diaminopimelate decarboxylase, partial [Acidimicrobiia bacterium]|nr:diaminopimelate decarboxylase [Acidimicrobiia bacterium]
DPVDRSILPAGLRDLDLDSIAAEYGTPAFVYDEAHLRARCREYVEHFGADHVAYAGKAFLCTAMAQLIAEEGLHLDVATGGELFVALHAGFPAERLVFHGNNKSDAEIASAARAGVGRIVADSFDELERLEASGFTGDVLVRVTPGVEAHTHEYIQTGTDDSKFGFTVSTGAAADAVARVVGSDALRFGGIHAHIGSQVFRLDSYARAAAVVGGFADECERTTGAEIPLVNLGGGLGARYLNSDPDPSVAEYAAALRTGLGGRPMMVEPGRSIAAVAAVTLYRVGTVKTIPGGRTYVAVDGGMSDNPRPVLYGAGYEAFLADRPDAPRPLAVAVAGKHCEQGDVIVPDGYLPADVAVGDLLVTPVTGAYGYSMASNYNKVPRPVVLFVRDGQVRVVVRRETPDDLIRLDA